MTKHIFSEIPKSKVVSTLEIIGYNKLFAALMQGTNEVVEYTKASPTYDSTTFELVNSEDKYERWIIYHNVFNIPPIGILWQKTMFGKELLQNKLLSIENDVYRLIPILKGEILQMFVGEIEKFYLHQLQSLEKSILQLEKQITDYSELQTKTKQILTNLKQNFNHEQ